MGGSGKRGGEMGGRGREGIREEEGREGKWEAAGGGEGRWEVAGGK